MKSNTSIRRHVIVTAPPSREEFNHVKIQLHAVTTELAAAQAQSARLAQTAVMTNEVTAQLETARDVNSKLAEELTEAQMIIQRYDEAVRVIASRLKDTTKRLEAAEDLEFEQGKYIPNMDTYTAVVEVLEETVSVLGRTLVVPRKEGIVQCDTNTRTVSDIPKTHKPSKATIPQDSIPSTLQIPYQTHSSRMSSNPTVLPTKPNLCQLDYRLRTLYTRTTTQSASHHSSIQKVQDLETRVEDLESEHTEHMDMERRLLLEVQDSEHVRLDHNALRSEKATVEKSLMELEDEVREWVVECAMREVVVEGLREEVLELKARNLVTDAEIRKLEDESSALEEVGTVDSQSNRILASSNGLDPRNDIMHMSAEAFDRTLLLARLHGKMGLNQQRIRARQVDVQVMPRLQIVTTNKGQARPKRESPWPRLGKLISFIIPVTGMGNMLMMSAHPDAARL